MTSRERVLKAMRREIPDKVPKDMSWGMTPIAQKVFEEKTGGMQSPEEYFGIDVRLMDFDIPEADIDSYAKYYGDLVENPRFSINAYGVGEMLSEKTDFHFTQMVSPLKNAQTLNEFIDYKLPDVMDEKCFKHLFGKVTETHENGLAAIGPTDLTVFELAWAIRGYEEFMVDMLINPEFAECLLDRILDMRIAMAKKFVEMGIDVVTGGDDVACQRGMLMKRETFCELLKPRYEKLIGEVKGMNPDTLFFFHTDGDAHEIIGDLIDVGADILNPCQPECNDLSELKKQYGDKIAFWGAIGTQHILPFGTRGEIRAEVKRLIRTVGADGGLLLGPTHFIEPEVPWENVVTLYEAIEEFGTY